MHSAKCATFSFWATIRQIAFVFGVGLSSLPIALAQGVGGRATDQSGGTVPGVGVSAQNTSTNVVITTKTDDSGYYTLQLAAGDYTITASVTGFGTLVQRNVSVTIGGDVGLDLHLQVAATTTSVEVHADEALALINPNTTEVQTTVDNTIVSTLPVEVSGTLRNASSFLALEPGYNGTSLNGGEGSDQVTTLDGADVSGVGFGSGGESIQYAMPVPSFSVQEFQVVGSNADADVGRNSTGAITYATKSGTNQLHGSVFDYNRNTIYDAKTYFEPTRGVDHQNEFGLDVGGAIQRDKSFFYGYYDGFRYSTSNTGTFYSLLTHAMKNVGAVAAVGAFGSSGALIASHTSAAQATGSGGPRVLILMADRYHNQSSIRIALYPIFTELALPVDYTTNYYDLSADLLKPYQLFVCYRDNAICPGGYLGSDEDPVGRSPAAGLEDAANFPPEKAENWMTETQGQAVKDFVSRGNGFLSLHNSSYISRPSKNYRDVQGGVALGHTLVRPFNVRIVNEEHPITEGIEDFMVVDEQQYATYDKDQKDVLLRAEKLDGLTFAPGARPAGGRGSRGGGGFQGPAADVNGAPAPGDLGTTSVNGWAHNYEQGRVVFLALGHAPEATQPEYIKIQKNSIRWLLKMA